MIAKEILSGLQVQEERILWYETNYTFYDP